MPLHFFYTMEQKSQKWPKTQIKGGGGGVLPLILLSRGEPTLYFSTESVNLRMSFNSFFFFFNSSRHFSFLRSLFEYCEWAGIGIRNFRGISNPLPRVSRRTRVVLEERVSCACRSRPPSKRLPAQGRRTRLNRLPQSLDSKKFPAERCFSKNIKPVPGPIAPNPEVIRPTPDSGDGWRAWRVDEE